MRILYLQDLQRLQSLINDTIGSFAILHFVHPFSFRSIASFPFVSHLRVVIDLLSSFFVMAIETVMAQEYTANPKADPRLGEVGRGF